MSAWNPQEVERVATAIVDCSVKIHQTLGPGLLESVYVRILVHELRKRGLDVKTEVPVHVHWDGEDLGVGYRVDLLVNDCVVVEAKSVEANSKLHSKQALTYICPLGLPLAFVLNFGQRLMKEGIERVANDYYRSVEL
ncbi:MAG: GxxExxY protein [Planctomycetes bacterium]|nr:GxxExxY protein [Planctomycetota bacterium]